MSINGSVFEVLDRDEVDSGESQLGGLYTNLSGDVDYGHYGSRTQFAAIVGGSLRYYSRLSEFVAADYHGGVGVNTRITRRSRLFLTQTLAYSPVALPGLFANPLPAEVSDSLSPDPRFAVTADKLITSATTVSLEHGFSIRSQLIATSSYRYTNFLADSVAASDWSTMDSGLTYRYRVSSEASLRLAYNHRRASYSLLQAPDERGPQPTEHKMFVGVAVDRAYSRRQRTMVSFAGGTSIFTESTANELRQVDRLRLLFEAALAHQFGRSWLLLASFDRGGQFNQGYGGPVFSDSAYVSVTGFVNPRTDVTLSLAHTEGASVLTIAGPPFTTATAGVRIRHALSRQWALSAEYLRYSYDLADAPDVAALIGVPDRFRRNSLRGGVAMFLPITPR